MIKLFQMAGKHFVKSRKKESEKDERGSPQFNDLPAENIEENIDNEGEEIKNLGKLFVGGLSHSTTEKQLEDYFSKFGKVADAVVRRLRDGKHLRFGFVTFADPKDAKAALQIEVHILDGKLIELRPFRSKRLEKVLEHRVFLGGLPYDITEETLRQFFSRYGEIVEVVIPRDKNKKQNKGYGFLEFADQKTSEKCLADKFVFLGGRRVHIEKVEPQDLDHSKDSDGTVSETNSAIPELLQNEDKSEDENEKAFSNENLTETRPASSGLLNENYECRVFLGGLPHDVTEKTLRQFFSRYGEIVEVVIPRDKNKKQNKGFGFLNFADRSAAEKCEADKFVFLCGRRVQIKNAEPRNRYKSSDMSSLSNVSETNSEISEFMENEGESEDDEVQSDISENAYLAIEQNAALKKLFENHFLEKLARFDEKMMKNEKETEDFKCTEIEKLLAHVLTISKNNPAASSTENLINFSSESEDETEVGGHVADSFPSGLSKSFLPDDKNASVQKAVPLQIRNSEGFLMCSVCHWISSDDSTESFLAHCKTSLHKTNLKERFPSEQTRKQLQKIDSKANSVLEKPSASSSTKATEKKVKNIKKEVKEKPLAAAAPNRTNKEQSKATAPNKTNKEQGTAANKTKDLKQETEVDKNLQIHALAKGMASIQPFSKDELMCKMCNKRIPKASEFEILMKNVSTHLQSKMHLKNLSDTKNSLMVSHKPKPNIPSKEKEKAEQKQKKKKKGEEGIIQDKISSAGNPQNASKAINNAKKKQPTEKKVENATQSGTKLLCLPCNVGCESIEVFNVHIKLKTHLDNLSSKNVKADVSMTNMGKCKGCKFYLYGSLYQINKHYSKCSNA